MDNEWEQMREEQTNLKRFYSGSAQPDLVPLSNKLLLGFTIFNVISGGY